jgi:hypothetical protein
VVHSCHSTIIVIYGPLKHVSIAGSVSPSRHPKKTWNPQKPLGISALIQRPTILSHYHREGLSTPFPRSQPTVQSFHPLPVQCFPFHLTTYRGRLHMVSPLPLLPLLSGDQFSSKPLDQIVPISSKGIYQVPGFCCKVVKKEMDNGNKKRDKSAQSKNVIELFGRRQFFSFLSRSHTHDQTKRR